MTTDKNNELKTAIEEISDKVNVQKSKLLELQLDAVNSSALDNLQDYLDNLKRVISEKDLSGHYIQQFGNEINNCQDNIFRLEQQLQQNYHESQKERIAQQVDAQLIRLNQTLEPLRFNFSFFEKLNFFSSNIVAVGANGCGKTTLSNHLKHYLPKNGLVISAQKLLIIPTFSGISNIINTEEHLKEHQNKDKSLKVTYQTEGQGTSYSLMVGLGDEFRWVLDNLMAERNAKRNEFCEQYDQSNPTQKPFTKFDRAIQIWNSLITHRTLKCNDGINLTLDGENISEYPAHQMSDGEKVALFLIAHILQAPESGFIIIDEPEMYLHKTIVNKLWDTLEDLRKDCIFIYLTHDLDFATNRSTSKKVWIKSYTVTPKQDWEIENIPENEIPENLILELLGSRRNILFCEGNANSLDKQIFEILFPHFTIKSLGSCKDVINYTKAFNQLPSTTTKAIGMIDSDFRSAEQIESLKTNSIYTFNVAEIENLLLDEDFLKICAAKLMVTDLNSVNTIKDKVSAKFCGNIEEQASNFISAKIDYLYKEANLSKGKTLNEVKSNQADYQSNISIDEWYIQRKNELEAIKNDYSNIISKYNNKGLKAIVNECFKISNFSERAISILREEQTAKSILKKYFPEEIHQ